MRGEEFSLIIFNGFNIFVSKMTVGEYYWGVVNIKYQTGRVYLTSEISNERKRVRSIKNDFV